MEAKQSDAQNIYGKMYRHRNVQKINWNFKDFFGQEVFSVVIQCTCIDSIL